MTPDRCALRIACVHHEVWLNFGSAAERDRVLHSVAILEDGTLLIAPGEGKAGVSKGWEIAEPDCDMQRRWPYFCSLAARNGRSYRTQDNPLQSRLVCPRFALVEVEGVWEDDLLRIDLPALEDMPWPCTRGAIGEREHLRTAAERLLWGVSRGVIQTKMDAARFLRERVPERVRPIIQRAWRSLLDPLDLPTR